MIFTILFYEDRSFENMIMIYCILNIIFCCFLPFRREMKQIMTLNQCMFQFIIYRRIFDTICIHFQCSFFSFFLYSILLLWQNISTHYCPLSSLIDLASCHIVPVEVSPVWSRSHIHKVLSPELFKNITKKSHTKLQGKRETIYFAHPEKHSVG